MSEIDYKKLYESASDALAKKDADLEHAKQLNNVLNAEKKQWEQQKVMQDMIIKQQLEAADNTARGLQEELRILKQKHNIKV